MMNLDQRKMQQAMSRMGISQVEVPAKEVIIRTDESEIVISEPNVAKVHMMGQTTFQISGTVTERSISAEPELSEEDIKTVMEQADVSREKALGAITEAKGDLAQAILDLKKE
jgi:nascent polypeptide-associated complex subunit alpha